MRGESQSSLSESRIGSKEKGKALAWQRHRSPHTEAERDTLPLLPSSSDD